MRLWPFTRKTAPAEQKSLASPGRIREMEAAIQADPEPDLMLKLIRVQDKAMASARQLAAELGLTPVSRSRPAIREDDERDDTDNPLDVG